MDRQIVKKKNYQKKGLFIVLPIILLSLLSWKIYNHKPQVNIERSNITIREVAKDQFEDFTMIEGIVTAKKSILLNVIEGGSVAEIYKENGDIVKKGTPLLRLYNPNSELNYLTQETAIVEQINNLMNIRINLKSQQLDLTEQRLSIDNSFKNAERSFKVDTALYNGGAISKVDYEVSVQEYNYQNDRNKNIRESVNQEDKDRKIQLDRINHSIENMEKSLALLERNKENFIIKAPVDGLLSSFEPMLGQSYVSGENIGTVDMKGGHKIVAMVDEFYLPKMNTNVLGRITIENEEYKIKVSKIHPKVENGRFQMEFLFSEEDYPEALTTGMTLKAKVFLSGRMQALLIPKGLFYQSSNGKYVFKLSNENMAIKSPVKIGRENPQYYEVLSGVKEGDKIITSTYEDYQEVDQINIK